MTSLVDEIVAEFQRRIVSDIYKIGEQLPNEAALTTEFGVSRTVLREAMARLEALGLLSREQGRGTFIRSQTGTLITTVLEANLSVTEMIENMGQIPGTRDVELIKEKCRFPVAKALSLDPSDTVLVVKRVRTANGTPVIYSVDYLPLNPPPPEDPSAYTSSLYELLNELHQKPIEGALARIVPETAGPIISTKLEVETGDLLLALHQIHYLKGGKTILYSDDYFRDDVFTIYVRRYRDKIVE